MTARALPLIVLFLVLTLAACDDDCGTCPPPDLPPEPTLENVWPNDDGRQWTYDFTAFSWIDETTAPTDSFTIDDVDSLISVAPGAPAGIEDEAGVWRLQFDGNATTESGAQGQLLRGTFFVDGQPIRRQAVVEEGSWLRRIVPPRRATIDEFLARRVQGPGALLLGGDSVFEKNEAWIGTYGALDQNVAWKYLEANLEVGHTFSMQLVPALADDVFLFVRVRAVRDLETPYGTFPNTVSVDYLVDQGLQIITDEGGEEIGRSRFYTFGRMEFAPEVGPVYALERIILPEIEAVPAAGVAFDYEYVLIGSGEFEG